MESNPSIYLHTFNVFTLLYVFAKKNVEKKRIDIYVFFLFYILLKAFFPRRKTMKKVFWYYKKVFLWCLFYLCKVPRRFLLQRYATLPAPQNIFCPKMYFLSYIAKKRAKKRIYIYVFFVFYILLKAFFPTKMLWVIYKNI